MKFEFRNGNHMYIDNSELFKIFELAQKMATSMMLTYQDIGNEEKSRYYSILRDKTDNLISELEGVKNDVSGIS